MRPGICIFFALFILSFGSCKKNDQQPEGCTIDNSRITRTGSRDLMSGTDTTWSVYSYNNQNRVTSAGTATVSYPDPVTVVYSYPTYSTCYHINTVGHINYIEQFYGTDTSSIQTRYFHNNSQHELVHVYMEEGIKINNYVPTFSDSATFQWTNGNITRYDWYSSNGDSDHTVFTYDAAVSGRQLRGGQIMHLAYLERFINYPDVNVVLTKHAVTGYVQTNAGGSKHVGDFQVKTDDIGRITEVVSTTYLFDSQTPTFKTLSLYEYECY